MAKDFPCRIHLPESFPDSVVPYIDVIYISGARPGSPSIKLSRSGQRVREGTEEPGQTRFVELHLAGTMIFRGSFRTFMPSTDVYLEDLLPEDKPVLPDPGSLRLWKLSVPDGLASRGLAKVTYGDTPVCIDCDEDEFVICESQIHSLRVNGVDIGPPGSESTVLPILEKDFSEDAGSSTAMERIRATPPPVDSGIAMVASDDLSDLPPRVEHGSDVAVEGSALAALEKYDADLQARLKEQQEQQESIRASLESEAAARQREQLDLQSRMYEQMTEQERVRYESDVQLYNQQEALRQQLAAQQAILEEQNRDLLSQREHIAALIEQQRIRDEIAAVARQQAIEMAESERLRYEAERAQAIADQRAAAERQIAVRRDPEMSPQTADPVEDPYVGKIYGNINPQIVEMLGLSVYDLYAGNEIVTQDGRKWVVTVDKFRNTKLVEYRPSAGLVDSGGGGVLKGLAIFAAGAGMIYAARPGKNKEADKEKKK